MSEKEVLTPEYTTDKYKNIPLEMADCRFIRLGCRSKTPAPGQVKHFRSDTCNYAIDDTDLIQHITAGNNYGVLPRNAILIIDCDSSELWDRIPAHWKESFVVTSGRENGSGRHIYLRCQDGPTHAKIVFPGELGDIRFSNHNSYVVGPYSMHPDTGRQYTHNDNEILEVSWSELSAFIEANNGAVKKSKTQEEREVKIVAARERRARGDSLIAEVCNLKPEDYIHPLNAKIVGNVIMGSNPVFGSTNGFNLHIDTQRGLFYDFRNGVGGDGLHALCIARGLISFEELGPNCLNDIWADVFQLLEDEGFHLGNTGMDTTIAKEFLRFLETRRANHDR